MSEVLKKKLAGVSLGDLLKKRKTQKARIISDVEFLSNEQYDFLESHTQSKFYTFMEQYWGAKLADAGITCKTFDGEVLNVEPGSIRVVDKRWKGASHCICGKAIRYEYWIQHYGPIGSVHIVEHTNLDKTLVSDITKGYKKENSLRTEIVRMLADLKDEGRTLKDWQETFDLDEKMKYIERVSNPEKRELIKRLVELNLPLPEELRHALSLARRLAVAKQSSSETETSCDESREIGGVSGQLIARVDELSARYDPIKHSSFSTSNMGTLISLQSRLSSGRPTLGQLNFCKALLEKLEDALKNETSASWQKAQHTAKRILDILIQEPEPSSFVKSLHNTLKSGALTKAQLDCIFRKDKVHGRNGLYYQHLKIMNEHKIDPIEISSY